ncbi:MAG: hypothetical protein KGJ09_07620 [Candidatus Omnitrophica bacterium]|nr:hypothetical protein [Candidatus Omnitrophota bacterium]MDE2009929.1 hypothetical protein [Candidatus Omnitrophota bacterium]MDE2215017.1 hypothetical protein [Candidatus Omnitrophota bacterium]MDE2232189.1 hypothetical protein [Candidatus Omnitrophota bacterium]
MKIKIKRCCLCTRWPVYTARAKYCLRCRKFMYCMKNRRINGEAAERIKAWVRHCRGFFCFYTGVELNLEDPADPYYFEFDHFVPGDRRRMNLTCTLFNEIKSDLLLQELKRYVHQLEMHWTTGAPVKKMKLKFWFRLTPPKAKDGVFLTMRQYRKLLALAKRSRHNR